jgi:zinc transporter ZupT
LIWIFCVSLLFSGVCGFLLTIRKNYISGDNIKLLLAFSGAFLLALTLFHLIPEVYERESKYTGLFILCGFIIQILLDFISKGVEHGHVHKEDFLSQSFPYAVFVGLCVHSYLEALPLGTITTGMQQINSSNFKNNLFLGILIHNIPISVALTGVLIDFFKNQKKALVWLLIFSSAGPLGILTSVVLSYTNTEFSSNFEPIILSVVVGILLHVSTIILFESSDKHKFNTKKLLVIFFGFLISYLTLKT